MEILCKGNFRRFDFGMDHNLRLYKVAEPPMYNVSAITAPIALYYSQNDFFAALDVSIFTISYTSLLFLLFCT